MESLTNLNHHQTDTSDTNTGIGKMNGVDKMKLAKAKRR